MPVFTRYTEVRSHRRRVGPAGCCILGLLPAVLLFLPFMIIYPSKGALISIINFHRKRTSSILNKLHFKCGFNPSCSEYSKKVIKRYGPVKGGIKSIYRILSCNPFSRHLNTNHKHKNCY